MYHLVLLFTAAALLGTSCKSATVSRHVRLLSDTNNHTEHKTAQASSQTKRFLNMTRRLPGRSVHRAGRTLELTCEAVGTPAPSIRWFKDDAPIYEYDKESNEIIDVNPASLARVSSTLLVSSVADEAQYTCLAFSGSLTTRASTTVFNEGTTVLTERSKLVPLEPRVLLSYKVLVETIGSTARLPCRARGHPRPRISWRDNNGGLVTKNYRMKVLRSGELVISQLQWSDMGEFSCTATNLFGSSEIKTFVYPARCSSGMWTVVLGQSNTSRRVSLSSRPPGRRQYGTLFTYAQRE